MRSLLLVASAFLVHARPADACCAVTGGGACGYSDYALHMKDAAQADDATPPTAPTVDVEVTKYDQGCGSNGLALELTMKATDDRAPAERIGFVIAVASGNISIDFDPGPIVPYDGPVSFYFDEDELPFAGELEVRAIDLNGNIGPPTIVAVSSTASSRTRFASVRGAAPLVTFGMLGLALVIARRRRRR